MDSKLKDIQNRIARIKETLDLEKLTSRKGELETKSMEEDFWQNQEKARETMQEISEIENIINEIADLEKSQQNLQEYWELAKEEDAQKAEKDAAADLADLETKLEKFELQQFLSGKYDKNNAVLTIHAGQGGTEAQDWTEMLMRMYTMYSEKEGWNVEVIHKVPGEEAGLNTVTLEITGKFAYGYLKNEKGTHRLVRLSPFNAQNLRQTSFAGVEVMPVLEKIDEDEIEIPDSDLEFKAMRAGGPGGQSVNKTSSAVMLRHIPTGITVHSSAQRSQLQNREAAMRLLKSKLWELKEEEREEEKSKLKGEHKAAAWGNQIRNYVLHPYKLVKDLRTGVESKDPDGVLDGGLDEFVESELRL